MWISRHQHAGRANAHDRIGGHADRRPKLCGHLGADFGGLAELRARLGCDHIIIDDGTYRERKRGHAGS